MDNINNYLKQEVTLEEWEQELNNGMQGMQSGHQGKIYTSVDGKLKRQIIYSKPTATTFKAGDIDKKKTSSPSYKNVKDMIDERTLTSKKYKYWVLLPLSEPSTIDNIIKDMT